MDSVDTGIQGPGQRVVHKDVSVIVCTYNPEQEIFRRCLNALASQKTDGLVTEGFLVDNNCNPSLGSFEYVREFLAANPNYSIIEETTPGLTYARIAGVTAATGELCVFVDDDNEPASDYISRATQIGNDIPELGAWGTGHIVVEFIGKSPEWIQAFKHKFQDKELETPLLWKKTHWNKACPVGTGMVIKRHIIEDYVRFVKEGKSRTTDRKGRSLSSGGDVQIVMTAIKQGYTVGSFPELKMGHLIPARKATMSYLKKHAYGCAFSYDTAMLDMFPERTVELRKKVPSSFIAFKSLLKYSLTSNPFKRTYAINLAKEIGHIQSKYLAFEIDPPRWLSILVRIYKIG